VEKMFIAEHLFGKPVQVVEQNTTPFTEIVLIDAVSNKNTSSKRIYQLPIEAHRIDWGFGSGKSHCGVAKSIIKKIMLPNVNCVLSSNLRTD
jgi:hypothetical protein